MDTRSGSALSGGAASLGPPMPWTAASPERRTLLSRCADWLEREAFLLPFVAVYVFLLMRALPGLVAQDSWLALLGGREVWRHGLLTQDTLAVLTQGSDWIDQQWLAQTASYGLFGAGGLPLVLAAHVAILVLALSLTLAVARRRGASSRRVGLVAPLVLFVIAPNAAFRTQTFAYPLFVGILWLLMEDARKPSRRVFLTVPLLALWANLHGSVVLGAALVGLYGVALAAGQIRRRADLRLWLPRAASLVVLPVLALFASPYGPSLFGYYERTIANSSFSAFVPEWRPASFPAQWPFFVLGFAALWLAGRHGRRLGLFEQLTLLVTFVGGLLAVRNGAWFGLAALAILPVTLEAAWPVNPDERRRRRLSIALALGAVAFIGVAAAAALAKPASWLERNWPSDAVAGKIAREAASDPSVRVLADSRYGDWLLWKRPELAGRVAFDVRFELLSGAQLEQIANFQSQVGDRWKTLADGYRLVVLDRSGSASRERSFLREPGARALYRDDNAVVILRP